MNRTCGIQMSLDDPRSSLSLVCVERGPERACEKYLLAQSRAWSGRHLTDAVPFRISLTAARASASASPTRRIAIVQTQPNSSQYSFFSGDGNCVPDITALAVTCTKQGTSRYFPESVPPRVSRCFRVLPLHRVWDGCVAGLATAEIGV